MTLFAQILWVVVIITILYVGYQATITYMSWKHRIRCFRKLPGVQWNYFLGALYEFPGPGESGLKFVQRIVENYPRIAHMFFGPVNVTVALMHPDTMKAILKTSEPKPLEIGGYFVALPWLGDGLLTSGGHKWARNRRLLTPAFHFDILKPYMKVNNQASDKLVANFGKFAEKDEYLEVFSLVSLCTLEVILVCAFSYKEDIQSEGKVNPYVQAVQYLGEKMVYRALRPWLYPSWMFYISPTGRKFNKCCDYVHQVSHDVIQRRKTTLDAEKREQTTDQSQGNSKRMLDFLDILLTARDENGQGMSDREIRDEVDTFLFEGHDTTASGISWCLYTLAQHPEWQRQCQHEMDVILDGRNNDNILWDDLPKFKILTACIKEVLRLHNPVPFIERQTTKDMYIDGYFIPSGTVLDIHLYAMMHNPAVWDHPEEFRPERFMDGAKPYDTYAFIPFSAGPRNCIGQHFAMHEMKVVVGRIIRQYDLEVDPGRPAKHEMQVVMKTEDGMYIKARRRKQH